MYTGNTPGVAKVSDQKPVRPSLRAERVDSTKKTLEDWLYFRRTSRVQMPLLDLESIRFRRLVLWSGKGSALEGCRNLDEVVEAISDARCRARANGPDDGDHLRVPDDAFGCAFDRRDRHLSLYRHLFGHE